MYPLSTHWYGSCYDWCVQIWRVETIMEVSGYPYTLMHTLTHMHMSCMQCTCSLIHTHTCPATPKHHQWRCYLVHLPLHDLWWHTDYRQWIFDHFNSCFKVKQIVYGTGSSFSSGHNSLSLSFVRTTRTF